MWSAFSALCFWPILVFKLLALLQTLCVDIGLSACDCVPKTVRLIAESCWASWCCIYTVTTWPFALVAHTVESSKGRVSSLYRTATSSWVANIIHVMTTPFTCLWAKVCQKFSEQVSWWRNLPSRLRIFLYKAFFKIAKAALQLLWSCCYELCITGHASLLILLSGPTKESPPDAQVLLLLPHTVAYVCGQALLNAQLLLYLT